jgi:hypothetical protein
MITHVVSQDDAETDSWALARHNLAGGVISISVPSGSASMSSIAHEIAESLGLEMDSNPQGRSEVEVLELVRSLIRGHGVRELILVHADWLPLALLDDLARWITLLGLDAYFITHPPVGADGWLEGWTSAVIGWSDFVALWVRGDRVRSSLAADAARHQADPLPSIEMALDSEPMAVPERLDGSAAIVGYAQLRAALSTAVGSPAKVSGAVRSVLRSCRTVEELEAVLPGVTRALDQAGLALHVNEARLGRSCSSEGGAPAPTWADLRRAGNPTAAAAIALLGANLTLRDVCVVRLIDIATDGAWVADASGFRPLPLAARPFVVAARLMRVEAGAGPEDPFIVSHGRQIGPATLARLVTGTFAGLGVTIDTYELRRRMKPNERWLRERGFLVTGTRSADHCRHGLPATVTVEGSNLSHSRRACLVIEAADIRTAKGSVVDLMHIRPAGALYEVHQFGRSAGHVWLMHTQEGPAWLDLGSDATPSIDAVAAAISQNHPKCVLAGSQVEAHAKPVAVKT